MKKYQATKLNTYSVIAILFHIRVEYIQEGFFGDGRIMSYVCSLS